MKVKFTILGVTVNGYINYGKCEHQFFESEVKNLQIDPKCVKCGVYLSVVSKRCIHEYPSVWASTTKPNCIKCGEQSKEWVWHIN